MGNKIVKFLSLLLVSSLVFLSLAVQANAESGSSLSIKTYKVDAEVMKDGSMTVVETVTFHFESYFNGVTKQIVFTKSSGIKDLKVAEVSNGSQKQFNMVGSASNGENGIYTIDKSVKDTWMLKIYRPSNKGDRTFMISYTLMDVAARYNDTGELNWNFIGKENKTPMESVLINIKVPQGAANGELKVFGHGPLNGVSKIVDNRTVSLSINDLTSGTNIEARVLFPPNLIPDSRNVVNENALSRILDQEKAFADAANARREQARIELEKAKARGRVLNISAIILILISFYLIYIQVKKYGKDPKPGFEGKYYRELPEDCTPAVMSSIYNFKTLNTRDITATLMDLVRKRYLKIDENDEEIFSLIGKKTKENYTIIKIKEADDNLLAHEKYFMNWMINQIGDGTALSFDDIKKYSKSRSNALEFSSSYKAWGNLVKKEAESKEVFEKPQNKGKLTGIMVGIFDFIAGIAMIFGGGYAGLALMIIGMILIVVPLTLRKRTEYGSTQYAMWKAFRNYLKDFSNLKEAEIPSLVIWEHYLVYATSLGVAKEVIKQLKVVIREDVGYYNSQNLTYLYMSGYGNRYSPFDRFDNISSNFERMANSVFTAANSSNSSSSGGGGGFSSGSSGGGGGGGFGGF